MPQPAHRGEYPSDWKDIAALVKREALGRCVRCDHQHAPEVGRTLTVHHFDGDKANCERWNLMALCQACHLSVQARVDPAQGLMATPSIWAMPYIAGMIEAGKTPIPPTYDLSLWRAAYGSSWPMWAPCPARVE